MYVKHYLMIHFIFTCKYSHVYVQYMYTITIIYYVFIKIWLKVQVHPQEHLNGTAFL